MKTKNFVRALVCLLGAVALTQQAHAQNTIAVSASHIQGLNGTLLSSGSLCFQGTDQNNVVISYQQGGGGPVVTTPFCTSVTAGAISTFNIPNPANTAPINIRYHITVVQGSRTVANFPGVYLCIATGACTSPYTFNFDNCLSSGACIANPLPITSGPAGPPGSSLPCVGSVTAYNGGTTYALNNCVSYSGIVYISLINSNTGHTPPASPTDWATSGSAAGNPVGTVTYTIYPATDAGCGTYDPSGTSFYCAKNGATGAIDFEGGDSAVVSNSAMNAVITTGGTFFFRTGIYLGKSCTLETAVPYTAQCAVWNIPALTNGTATWPSFKIVSESTNFQMDHGILGLPIETDVGTIFRVTFAARTSAVSQGASQLVGLWKQVNIAPLSPGEWNGPVFLENIGCEFPDNQNGNETCIDMLEANYLETTNVYARYTTPPSIPAAAGERGIVGPSTYTDGWRGTNTYARGYDTCMEVDGEHTFLDHPYMFECNTGLAFFKHFNRIGIYSSYPIEIIHPEFSEDINQVDIGLLGPPSGMLINMENALIEKAPSGPWTYKTGATEEAPGTTGGTVTFVASTNGLANATNFFTSGGQNYDVSQPSFGKTTGNKFTQSTAQGDFSTSKTTLASYTVAAKTQLFNSYQVLPLNTVGLTPAGGDYFLVKAWGTTRANANAKTLTIDWGGTTVSTVTSNANNGVLSVEARILTNGTGNNSQHALGIGTDGVAAPTTSSTTTAIDTSVAEPIEVTATTPSFAGTGPIPLLLYTYNFSTVENPLSNGGNFTGLTDTLPKTIGGNICEPILTSVAYGAYYTGPGTWPNDQDSQVTIATMGSGGGSNNLNVIVRHDTVGQNWYEVTLGGDTGAPQTAHIQAHLATGPVSLNSFTITTSPGDTIDLSVTGSSTAVLKVYQNGTLVSTTSDGTYATTITAGTPGFQFSTTQATVAHMQLSNWAGGLSVGGGTNADFTLQGFTVDYVVGTH